MGHKKPLVSVIIPCYKQALYLPEAIESVIAQTYTSLECIIVNDGSPDNTESIANEWLNKDGRIKYLRKDNGGEASARNMGISISRGEYILPLDSDDRIGATYIEKAMKIFEANPRINLVYCEAEYFGAKTGLFYLPDYSYTELLKHNMIFNSAVYKKSDYEKTNGYADYMNSIYEDWEFYIRLLHENSKVSKIKEVLFYYRKKEEEGVVLSEDALRTAKNTIFRKNIEVYFKYFCPIELIHLKDEIKYYRGFKKMYEDIYGSNSFMLGYFMLHPLSILKRLKPGK